MKLQIYVIFSLLCLITMVSCSDDCNCKTCQSCNDSDCTLNDADTENDTETEDADSDTEFVEDENSDSDTEIVCTEITIKELFLDGEETSTNYYGIINESLGSADKWDGILLQFYLSENETLKTGTYDLGTEQNISFAQCTECLFIVEDYDEESELPAKFYFQETGTLNVTEIKEGTGESKGIMNAKLVEVFLNAVTMDTVKVEGGACLELKNQEWNTICTPQCEGKVCGSDGCYGECGECGENETCSEDGTTCETSTDTDIDEDMETDIDEIYTDDDTLVITDEDSI